MLCRHLIFYFNSNCMLTGRHQFSLVDHVRHVGAVNALFSWPHLKIFESRDTTTLGCWASGKGAHTPCVLRVRSVLLLIGQVISLMS
jgi:hypothetical protein